MKKIIPVILIILGTTLVIAAFVFWVNLNTPFSSQSFGLSIIDWMTIALGILGLGSSIKGWIDLVKFKKEKSVPPTTEIVVQNGTPQISTGENARNIQTQTYIEQQIVQQPLELRRIERDYKREPLEFLDTYQIAQKLNSGTRVRFLDALDSARFSSQDIYDESRLFSIVYVKVQFFFALICGDSIVVTENQLFDSLGFLETFDELYKAANKADRGKDLPIRVALREGNDVFQSVARLLDNENFVLTLWKDLNNDFERRKIWAGYIRNRQKPIGKMAVKMEEKPLLEKLWTTLKYFNSDRCVSAKTTDEFLKRVKRVVDLKNTEIDALVTGISNDGIEERRYFDEWDEVNAAKEIREELIRIQGNVGEIRTRSQVRQQLEDRKNVELKQGVIELTDGLYNQSLGIATEAILVQNSTFPPQRNKYVAAGYALSTFINDKSNPSGDFVDSEIFSFDYFDNLQRLEDPKRKDELFLILETARKSAPWEKIIKMQKNDSWKRNLVEFNELLSNLQLVVKKYKRGSFHNVERTNLGKELDEYREELKKSWDRHIENISAILPNDCWNITSTNVTFKHFGIGHNIRIPYSYLKPKIDREYIDGFRNWRNNTSYKGVLDRGIDLSI